MHRRIKEEEMATGPPNSPIDLDKESKFNPNEKTPLWGGRLERIPKEDHGSHLSSSLKILAALLALLTTSLTILFVVSMVTTHNAWMEHDKLAEKPKSGMASKVVCLCVEIRMESRTKIRENFVEVGHLLPNFSRGKKYCIISAQGSF